MKTLRYLPLVLSAVASAFADDSEVSPQPQRPPQFPEPALKPEDKGSVIVGGQVRNPGAVKFKEGMTLAEALDAAGGSTEFGNVSKVTLIRDGKAKVFNGNKTESKVIPLKPGDNLEVPQKAILTR